VLLPLPAFAAPDPDVQAIMAAARGSHLGWNRLIELCDDVGARPAGSDALEKAVALTASWLRADGQQVTLDEVEVPVWIRGEARLTMLAPRVRDLSVLALGGSVGGRVEAPVVVVRSYDELDDSVKGKIVLYDIPMRPDAEAGPEYGAAVVYRGSGAARAAEHGAAATLTRSVTARSLYTPHTGAMRYADDGPRIPSAAIPVEDAEAIARYQGRGIEVRALLELGSHDAPPAKSHNVIGEVKGASDEIVLIGAHLDSWDVGAGAQDDGAGVVQVVEALRLIRAHGTPGRTVRGVLFTNEEHGLSGGKAYAATHGGEKHAAAIESDVGGGWPLAFGATGTPEQLAWFRRLAGPVGLRVADSGGGADISTLTGVLQVGLEAEHSHYFDVHHTHADTVEKVDPQALQEAAGRLAALAWELGG
jgi:hypothetical protein